MAVSQVPKATGNAVCRCRIRARLRRTGRLLSVVQRVCRRGHQRSGNSAQITLAVEDYNRLVRMIQQGAKLKMAVDLQAQFHNDDLMAYNTLAEIPGTDLKDELVMIGAHLDSWHSGTGATDNGAGVSATMEAVRILQALKLRPRRTIRIGLWTGEEQGLLGSRAYVADHFGYYTNLTNTITSQASEEATGNARTNQTASAASRPRRTLVRKPDHEKLSVYFNLDNGTGKIRGVYLQGNEEVRPTFRRWLEPFRDLGAETLTPSNTSGTDHLSFDDIGLPGFQFIQDPLEYNTRTHPLQCRCVRSHSGRRPETGGHHRWRRSSTTPRR